MLKNLYFMAIKILFFNYENIDNIIISNNIPFDEKYCKYLIGYWGKNKINPLTLILPKT